jgi:hypothetical protein
MMILKELCGDNRHCENLSATDRCPAIIGVVHDVQQVINDHITRYNVVCV